MECHICFNPAEMACPHCKQPVCAYHWESTAEASLLKYMADLLRSTAESKKFRKLMGESRPKRKLPTAPRCAICSCAVPNTREWVEVKRGFIRSIAKSYPAKRAQAVGYSLANPEGETELVALTHSLYFFLRYLAKIRLPISTNDLKRAPYLLSTPCLHALWVIDTLKEIAQMTEQGYAEYVIAEGEDNLADIEKHLKRLIARTLGINPRRVKRRWAKVVEWKEFARTKSESQE